MVHLESYLSGFADGEGCFCVTFNKSRRHKFGWDIRPSFSVSQNRERSEVLELFKEFFSCGTIRPDRSDRTLKYEVRCLQELVERVIPYFERYPMLSSKRTDFEKFAMVCRKMSEQAHLTRDGFNKIVALASQINATSKKRYSRTEIMV
jgi:hypothetical protein